MIEKKAVNREFRNIQDEICSSLAKESQQDYIEDRWDYQSGTGGGITRIFTGDIIEKGGVNFSSLSGTLSSKIAEKLKGKGSKFFAAGVSLVIHPYNPHVPTVHMNIRFLERGGKQWFGGGIDLTPYYPVKSEIVSFHKKLKQVCDKHNPKYYPEFKKNCDEYFYIKHHGEARGVGGIFFDYLSEQLEETFDFVQDVGKCFTSLYLPLLAQNKDHSYSNRQREFQLIRRGRYVEFNLVYDRGTLFGLETEGRIESILMSLPPLVKWDYNHQSDNSAAKANLEEFLVPKNWVDLE